MIAARNAKLLSTPLIQEKTCNCGENSTCPIEKKCLTKNVVYQATVKQGDGASEKCIGLTSMTFKARWGVHKNSFKDLEANQTSVSNHIWDLKNENGNPEITWKIVDRGNPFSPVSGKCQLCIKEKYYILFHPEWATLNSKNEIYANCRHKKSNLLIKPIRKRNQKKRKTRPG